MEPEHWPAVWEYLSDVAYHYVKHPERLEVDSEIYWEAFRWLTPDEAILLIDHERHVDDKMYDKLRDLPYYLAKVNSILHKKSLELSRTPYNPTPEQRKKDDKAMRQFWRVCAKAHDDAILQSDARSNVVHIGIGIGGVAMSAVEHLSGEKFFDR